MTGGEVGDDEDSASEFSSCWMLRRQWWLLVFEDDSQLVSQTSEHVLQIDYATVLIVQVAWTPLA